MDRREALRRSAIVAGFALSTSATMGILKGCAPSGRPKWPPRFLTNDEVSLVSEIADTILPTTDTPGAIDVNVPEFIDLMLKENFSSEEQQTFKEGASTFVKSVEEEYSTYFEKCDQEEKTKIISEEEQRSLEHFKVTNQKTFYMMVKELTILGYYTSEYVMTNMLDYHPVPSRYDGCIPFPPDGKLYVDNNV
jgi:gluconate 2-dehydrogenase gamma chain